MRYEDEKCNRFTWETASSVAICTYCKHRIDKTAKCKAFPDGFTSDIINKVSENINYQCSEKYRFEPIDDIPKEVKETLDKTLVR